MSRWPVDGEAPPPGSRLLSRPQGHAIRAYVSGPEHGTPVLLLHGGPGGGANLGHREFFDLRRIRLVQFDQRGTGRTAPDAPLELNTTAHQLDDIEALREELRISSWWVAGGSWGALLALAYAEAHPDRVTGLLLRSLFLDRAQDVDWLLRGARMFQPEAHRQLVGALGGGPGGAAPDAGELLASLYDAVLRWPEPAGARAVRAWRHYERVLSGLARHDDAPGDPSETDFLDTRLELHYLVNRFFLAEDQVASNAGLLGGVPGVVVQGEADLIAPPDNAYHLAERWPTAVVRIAPDARHSLRCPAMEKAWRNEIDAVLV